MPTPLPRCLICDALIDVWGSGQRPAYCDNAACRREGRANPRCGRCRQPLERAHCSQRYHPECAKGCKFCGKSLLAKAKGQMRQATYCSEACLKNAWKGQPLPTCSLCGETVPLPKGPRRALRDPGKTHPACVERHQTPRATAAELENEKVKAIKQANAKNKPSNRQMALYEETGEWPAHHRKYRAAWLRSQEKVDA